MFYVASPIQGTLLRVVCAKRGRLLRKRGEAVKYWGRSSAGQALYCWQPSALF